MARRYPREVHEFIAANVVGRTTRELVSLVNARFNLDFTESVMKSYKTAPPVACPWAMPPTFSRKLLPITSVEITKALETQKWLGD